VKKNYSSEHDRKKVRDLVTSERYSYSLGVTISYLPKRDYIKIMFPTSNNNWKIYNLYKRDFAVKKLKDKTY